LGYPLKYYDEILGRLTETTPQVGYFISKAPLANTDAAGKPHICSSILATILKSRLQNLEAS